MELKNSLETKKRNNNSEFERKKKQALKKYLGDTPLRSITGKLLQRYLDVIETTLPYLDNAVKKRVLLREILEKNNPKILKVLKASFKIAKPYLRENWGDEITATATTLYFLELYGDEIRKKVTEKEFANWILLQYQDFRKNFL